jgi:hypothetical protein
MLGVEKTSGDKTEVRGGVTWLRSHGEEKGQNQTLPPNCQARDPSVHPHDILNIEEGTCALS